MRDDEGLSLLDIALEYLYDDDGCVDVALYLMSRGCACGDEDRAKLLCGACYLGKLGAVKELVEQHKVDPRSECAVYLNGNIYIIFVHVWCKFSRFSGEERSTRKFKTGRNSHAPVFHMQSLASNRENFYSAPSKISRYNNLWYVFTTWWRREKTNCDINILSVTSAQLMRHTVTVLNQIPCNYCV